MLSQNHNSQKIKKGRGESIRAGDHSGAWVSLPCPPPHNASAQNGGRENANLASAGHQLQVVEALPQALWNQPWEMSLVPLPSCQVARTSHHTPRAPHSRDQHGLVLSVCRKGEETEKLAKVGNHSQVEHSGYPWHWGSPSTTQGQKWEGPSGIIQTPSRPCPAPTWKDRTLCQSVQQHQKGSGTSGGKGFLYRGLPGAGVEVLGEGEESRRLLLRSMSL